MDSKRTIFILLLTFSTFFVVDGGKAIISPDFVKNGMHASALESTECTKWCMFIKTDYHFEISTKLTDDIMKRVSNIGTNADICTKKCGEGPLLAFSRKAMQQCADMNSDKNGTYYNEMIAASEKNTTCLFKEYEENCADFKEFMKCTEETTPTCTGEINKVLKPVLDVVCSARSTGTGLLIIFGSVLIFLMK